MFTVIEICYERYGEQEIYEFDTLEEVLVKLSEYEWIGQENEDESEMVQMVRYRSKRNYIELIMECVFLHIVITGVSKEDKVVIENEFNKILY